MMISCNQALRCDGGTRLFSANPSCTTVGQADASSCCLFQPYKYTELPFWRKTKTTTSEMMREINEYCLRYEKLQREDRKRSCLFARKQAMAEFLFQVNKIEGEGYGTFMETMAAVAGGVHLEESPNWDRKAEAVRCLHQAMIASQGIVAESVPRLTMDGIICSHLALLGSSKQEIAGRLRCEDGEDVFTKTSTGYYRMFRKPSRVARDLTKLLDDCNTLVLQAFEQAGDVKERNEALLKLGGQLFFQFECIHPFKDGNGRIGRILLANLLRSVMPFPTVLFVDNGPSLDGFEYPPPFVDREYYIHCFEKAEVMGKQVDTWNGVPVFYNEEEHRAPCDLTALIIEGVYVGWRRFFQVLFKASST